MNTTGLKRIFSDKTIILMSVTVNIAVMALCALVFIPQAINNDDLIIHSITAGVYGKSSPGLVHTNILMGYALVFLQDTFSAANWFEITEYVLIFAGSVLMTCIVWLRNPDYRGLFIALSFCVLVSPYFFNELHNTKSTPFFSAAALLAILFGVLRKQNSWCVIGGLVSLLASMIRFDAFLIGAAFAFGACFICLIGMLKDPDQRKTAGRMIVVFSIVFAVIFGCYAADIALCAKDPEISYYREYNRARGSVSDYVLPSFAEDPQAYTEIGISENDYDTILAWNFSDPEVFDIETLYSIAALRAPVTLADAASNLVSDFSGYLTSVCLIIPSIVLFGLCLLFAKKGAKLISLWMAVAFFAVFYILCLDGRTTRWVIAGIAGAAICGLLYSLKLPDTGNYRIGFAATALILAACISYDFIALTPEISTYPETVNTAAYEPKSILNERGSLFIADIDNSISLQTATPVFSSVPRDIYKNIYMLGGWDSESPAKNSILERFGYSAGISPYRILAENPEVFLLDSYRPQQKIIFIREHFYPSASLALYETVGAQMIYSVSIEEFPDAEPSFSLIDTSIDYSEEFEGYFFIGASTDIPILESDTVYYELTDSAGTIHTYQARPIESEEGTGSIILWIPEWDLPNGISHLTLRVIVRNGDLDSFSNSIVLF